MSFHKAMKEMKFDVRLLEFNLANGVITKEEYEKQMASLQDCQSQSETLSVEPRRSSSEGQTH